MSEHWGCVLRSTGEPVFEALPGRVEKNKFSKVDKALPGEFRTMLQQRNAAKTEVDILAKQLAAQRLAPLEKHLQGAAKLYVVAVNQMAGIPIEVLTDRYTVSYVPSGTFLAQLKNKPLPQTAGVLALGDPIYDVRAAN